MIVIIENCRSMIEKAKADLDQVPSEFDMTLYFIGVIDQLHHNGVDGIILKLKKDPTLDPTGRSYDIHLSLEELDGIMISEAVKNLRAIPQQKKYARAELQEAVLNHVTGDGVRKHALVDYGIKCTVCGRSTIILTCGVNKDARKYLGCAYAIGNGLCLNYVTLNDEEFKALQDDMSSVKNMQSVMRVANKRMDIERTRVVDDMNAMRETCRHYIPGSQEARNWLYCTHPDEVERIKQHPESREYYTICCPQTCKNYTEK